jgi:hypothetical protein
MTRAQKSARRASLFLLLVFVAIYSSCSEETSLRCGRAEGVCHLKQERLLGTRQITIRVDDLLGAHVDWQRSGRGQGAGHTVLETRRGPVQFEVWGTSHMSDISSHVNDFVKSPKQPSLEVTHDSRLNTFGFGSFLLVGSLLLFGISFHEGVMSTGDR